MTFSDLRKKDVICVSDGRLLGRVSDLVIEASSGQILAVLIPSGTGVGCIWHGEKSQTSIAWQQIACIGDDVILVSHTPRCK
ncbi:MAG: YlmC/YmxH family sporulation protein [Clostridia bacterium]|nr:YlmC/YmxH family sporulation protein [Clostridia bacterium]